MHRISGPFSLSAERTGVYDLHFVDVARGEEGAQMGRSMSARSEFPLVVGAPLALDEAAGEFARRVDLLAVIDREGEEVAAWDRPRLRRPPRGRWCHRSEPSRRRRLLGQLAGFQDEGLTANGTVLHDLPARDIPLSSRQLSSDCRLQIADCRLPFNLQSAICNLQLFAESESADHREVCCAAIRSA